MRYEPAAIWAGTMTSGLGWAAWELGHHVGVPGAGLALFVGAFVGNGLVKGVIMLGMLAGWWR